MWGMLTGPSKVGLVAGEALKLRKFQVARVLSPLSWDIDHLISGPVEPLLVDDQEPARNPYDVAVKPDGGIFVPQVDPKEMGFGTWRHTRLYRVQTVN